MSVSSMQATHLFSFTECHKWKQFCILHFASFAHCAQVVLSHCYLRSAVCAGSQSNNPYFVTALLSALFSSHRLCEGLYISRLFLLTFFRPPRESGFWFFAEIIKPGTVIGPMPIYLIYHYVRCRNSDSSLIPYFHFFGYTDNQP